MTDEVQPGESRRDIAGNSLRALRAARGGPDRPASADSAEVPAGVPAEVAGDPAELTDDPAVRPDDNGTLDELPPATPDEAYADEVLDAETDAETADVGGGGHDDTDDPTVDDPAELTDDPSGLPDDAAYADEVLEVDPATDTTATPAEPTVPAGDDADAAYADEVLEVDPATDTTAAPAEPTGPAGDDADAAYADEVLEVDPATDTADDSSDVAGDSIADRHDDTDDTDDPTIDDPAELTDDPAEVPTSPGEAGAVSRVADSSNDSSPDDEPPTLAAMTPRSRRSKVSIDKTATGGSASEGGSATGERQPSPRTRRRPAPLVIALASATAVALVFAVVSAVVWYRTDNDDAREIATARNDVATDARIAVATVNTIDYTKASASLDQWLSISTGKFRSDVSDSKRSAAQVLAQAKVSTTAVVLDAAVTSLDTGKGTATVIVAVNVKKTPQGEAAATDRRRVRASMKLVSGEWKLADLGEVAGAVFQ